MRKSSAPRSEPAIDGASDTDYGPRRRIRSRRDRRRRRCVRRRPTASRSSPLRAGGRRAAPGSAARRRRRRVGARRGGHASPCQPSRRGSASRRAARRRCSMLPVVADVAGRAIRARAPSPRTRRSSPWRLRGSCARWSAARRVAFGQESRRDHADDQILGRRRARDPDAGPGVACDGARREPPGRQRVGILQRDLGLAGGVGDQIAEPVDRVGEVLADLRLDLLVALEVGQRERPPPSASQLQPIAARVAGEVVVARERRADAAVLAAIEEAHRIRRVVGLMPYTASSITPRLTCARTGAPAASSHLHGEDARVLRLGDGPIGRHRDCSARSRAGTDKRRSARYSRPSRMKRCSRRVADVAGFDRHLDRVGRGRAQQPVPRDVLAFLGHQHRP